MTQNENLRQISQVCFWCTLLCLAIFFSYTFFFDLEPVYLTLIVGIGILIQDFLNAQQSNEE